MAPRLSELFFVVAGTGAATKRNGAEGKGDRQRSRESENRMAEALRMAAQSRSGSDWYLGARDRKYRGRMEGKKAPKPMAHYPAYLAIDC